jgi:hypothetical protein
MRRNFSHALLPAIAALASPWATATEGSSLPPLPSAAKLVLHEDWSSGKIDPNRWYVPRKKWGQGNAGVVPENVRIVQDRVNGEAKPVLICQATGDLYDGPIVGYEGQKSRVGGVIVSQEFFASGRYEIVMKIGSKVKSEGGPEDPTRPKGAVPAIWTYGYRSVSVPHADPELFHPSEPLYNPHMKAYGHAFNEYSSEIDFPEFGKQGEFNKALYNTFLNQKHHTATFDVYPMIDGEYHTLTTDWRTKRVPIEGVSDSQVAKKAGFYWIQDCSIAFDRYLGNPLTRLGKDRYALHVGDRADHYLDGKKVAENTVFVPSLAAQLTLGIWLPEWAGPAHWHLSATSFASIKVWQFEDKGDVRGVITENINNNFHPDGSSH